eukprot:3601698-Amphidinium_carterae.1
MLGLHSPAFVFRDYCVDPCTQFKALLKLSRIRATLDGNCEVRGCASDQDAGSVARFVQELDASRIWCGTSTLSRTELQGAQALVPFSGLFACGANHSKAFRPRSAL